MAITLINLETPVILKLNRQGKDESERIRGLVREDVQLEISVRTSEIHVKDTFCRKTLNES